MRSSKIKHLLLALFISLNLINPEIGYGEGPRLKDLEIGRRLAYVISWNGIPVGTVTTVVEELTIVQGRKAYKASVHAKTNRWASLIYDVDDRFVTYIDYEDSTSLGHEVARSEGRYRKAAVIEYLYGKFLAQYQYLKDGRRKTINISPNVQDPLSAAYYFLRRDLKEGDAVALDIDLNEKSYKLYARIEKGKRLRAAGIGEFDTLIIRPYVEREERPYKRGNGWAYVALEKDVLPIYCVVDVFIWGRFTAMLLSVE